MVEQQHKSYMLVTKETENTTQRRTKTPTFLISSYFASLPSGCEGYDTYIYTCFLLNVKAINSI